MQAWFVFLLSCFLQSETLMLSILLSMAEFSEDTRGL